MAKTVTLNTGGIGIDLRDFARFAEALRRAEPEIAKQLRLSLRVVGESVAHDAEFLISPDSTTVPPSVKVRMSGLLTVAVVAGGEGIPIAGLDELGNTGAPGPTFRHPVFGDTTNWVEQPTHPFLLPALDANAERVNAAAVEALDLAIAIAVT